MINSYSFQRFLKKEKIAKRNKSATGRTGRDPTGGNRWSPQAKSGTRHGAVLPWGNERCIYLGELAIPRAMQNRELAILSGRELREKNEK